MIQGIAVLLFLFGISLPVIAEESGLQEASKLIESNRLDDAKIQLQKILDDKPQNPQALLLFSSVLLKENRVSQALQILTEQRQRLGNFPAYYNNLAYAYFYKGKDKLAIETLQKGLQQNTDYNTIYDNLSTIYAFLAKKAYDNAIDDSSKIQQDLPQLKLGTQIYEPNATVVVKNIPQKADLNDEKQQITDVLYRWAEAWSEQNSSRYLDVYSATFRTPPGVTIDAWRKYRDERLRAPSFIEVKLSDINIVIADDASLASVHFLQHYRSNTLNDKIIKQIVLQKETSNWMIISENVAN